MSLVVITGGARSGKSAAAQRLAISRGEQGVRVVVAVFGRDSDAEMSSRIEQHQQERPAEFETLEVAQPGSWQSTVSDDQLLVVDCLGTLLGLVMESEWPSQSGSGLGGADAGELPEGFAEAVDASFAEIVESLAARSGDTIIVTNETGLGVVPDWASARLFRDLLGRANKRLVVSADASYFYVCGRAIDLGGVPSHIHWPED